MDNIKDNNSITCAYQAIRKEIPIGTQYDWLARLAVDFPGIELGIEKPFGEYSGCVDAIERFGRLKQQTDSWVIDSEYSTPELNLLFGNFSFPIIQFTELDMVANIKKWHCESIMKQIWFCHSPIAGKPCGKCRPCQQKMECGMEFLLPPKAQQRYRIHKFIYSLMTPLRYVKSFIREIS